MEHVIMSIMKSKKLEVVTLVTCMETYKTEKEPDCYISALDYILPELHSLSSECLILDQDVQPLIVNSQGDFVAKTDTSRFTDKSLKDIINQVVLDRLSRLKKVELVADSLQVSTGKVYRVLKDLNINAKDYK